MFCWYPFKYLKGMLTLCSVPYARMPLFSEYYIISFQYDKSCRQEIKLCLYFRLTWKDVYGTPGNAASNCTYFPDLYWAKRSH